MTTKKEAYSGTRVRIGQRATVVVVLLWAACGMKTGMVASSSNPVDNGGSLGGMTGLGGITVNGSGGSTTISRGGSGGYGLGGSTVISHGGSGGYGLGGSTVSSGGYGLGGSTTISLGGSTVISRGGSGGIGLGGSGSGGRLGTGGATVVFRDAAVIADVRVVTDAMPGAPTIDPNSGYATVLAGTVILSGYVTSSAGGSGSSISLTCNKDSFCASGTVGASTTYNSWANTGFNVNQKQSGGSGSTGSLVLTGSTISISYVNRAGSALEFELWDSTSSNFWCYYLPPSTSPTTTTIPLSSLNTRCWDGSGMAFVSGTSITMVQLAVPGAATSVTPFDYCFLGLTVQ